MHQRLCSPEIGPSRTGEVKAKAIRQYSDNSYLATIQSNRSAEYVGIAGEPALDKPVGEEDDVALV